MRFLGRLRRSEYQCKCPPKGLIYVASDIRPKIKKSWNRHSFEDLRTMGENHFFKCNYYALWWTWKRFFEDMDKIEKEEYVFGKVTMEMF